MDIFYSGIPSRVVENNITHERINLTCKHYKWPRSINHKKVIRAFVIMSLCYYDKKWKRSVLISCHLPWMENMEYNRLVDNFSARLRSYRPRSD